MNKIEALRHEADMRELVEGTGLEWWECIKYDGVVMRYYSFFDGARGYEFALAVVEGKPVFNLDRIYYFGEPYIAGVATDFSKRYAWSWNPPKPKTVTIELTREEVSELLWFLGKECYMRSQYQNLKIAQQQ